jgi:nuclear pore complex protein Nup210
MEAVVTIAAYPPLVAVEPEDGIGIVTLGAYKEYVFEGGPMPWILDRSKFYSTCMNCRGFKVRSTARV